MAPPTFAGPPRCPHGLNPKACLECYQAEVKSRDGRAKPRDAQEGLSGVPKGAVMARPGGAPGAPLPQAKEYGPPPEEGEGFTPEQIAQLASGFRARNDVHRGERASASQRREEAGQRPPKR